MKLLYEESLKACIRIIKPWKKKPIEKGGWETTEYVHGWNDCLKEIQKNANKLYKRINEDFPETPSP